MIKLDSTGIEELDRMLGGGLPRPSTIGLVGPLGSGKSILARQIAVNMLKAGCAVTYYSIDQSGDDSRTALENMGVDAKAYEDQNSLCFIDIFKKGVERMKNSYTKFESGSSVLSSGLQFSDLIEMGRDFTLKNMKREHFGLMDSMTPLFLTSDSKEIFHYCQVLKYATRFVNAIGVAIHHAGVLEEKTENALFGFADGVIEMKKKSDFMSGGPVVGGIRVVRMANQPIMTGTYYYEIKEDKIKISLVPGIL
ncbi:RAD55 family ATPase [Candidatus Bathyarchaeota archaeon]|nr:RAD55 family ATPase [Candidatus Bathyarchaeota archaeon]